VALTIPERSVDWGPSCPQAATRCIREVGALKTDPIVWLTAVLAITAAIQVCVYWAMHRANVVAQRGWLNLDNLWLNFPKSDQPEGVSALIGIENSGGTPVFIEHAKVVLKISKDPLPEHPDYGTEYSKDPPATVVAKEKTRWRHHFKPGDFRFSDIAALEKGAMKLWLYGVIEYRDAFDHKHRYGFAREWDWFKFQASDGSKRGARFTHVHNPNYSYAD